MLGELNNIFELFSVVSPLLLVFFIVMLSFFNQDIKGFIYLAGILVSSALSYLMAHTIQDEPNPEKTVLCTILDIEDFATPVISNVIIAFTATYLLLPMRFNNNMNYPVILALLCLFGLDAYTKVANKCTRVAGSLFSGLIGGILGIIWFGLFYMTGNESLLYFDTYSSNRVFCEKPSQQKFKCRVYKNGELISSNVA